MSTNNSNSMRDMIYPNLELKDTEELLDIWTQNDHEAWSEEAFEIIRELLLKRLGHLPEQNPPKQVESREGIYHDPETLLKIANWLKILSWIIVTISALFFCGSIVRFVDPRISFNNQSNLPFLSYLATVILIPIGGISSFFVLQAIAGLIFLFMDIEKNTRRA